MPAFLEFIDRLTQRLQVHLESYETFIKNQPHMELDDKSSQSAIIQIVRIKTIADILVKALDSIGSKRAEHNMKIISNDCSITVRSLRKENLPVDLYNTLELLSRIKCQAL